VFLLKQGKAIVISYRYTINDSILMEHDFSAKILTQSEVYKASYQLVNIIMQSPYKFDLGIAIARGGFPVSRFICDFLNIRQLAKKQCQARQVNSSYNNNERGTAVAHILKRR
jgi:hypoxanthine phosphoribosyltransferase